MDIYDLVVSKYLKRVGLDDKEELEENENLPYKWFDWYCEDEFNCFLEDYKDEFGIDYMEDKDFCRIGSTSSSKADMPFIIKKYYHTDDCSLYLYFRDGETEIEFEKLANAETFDEQKQELTRLLQETKDFLEKQENFVPTPEQEEIGMIDYEDTLTDEEYEYFCNLNNLMIQISDWNYEFGKVDEQKEKMKFIQDYISGVDNTEHFKEWLVSDLEYRYDIKLEATNDKTDIENKELEVDEPDKE